MLQELMVYAGQQDCYGNSQEVLKKFLDIEMSETQVYRVTDFYGERLGKEAISARCMPLADEQDTVYVELDGSMVLTREEGWKEVKLSRVFKASDYVENAQKGVGWIKQSQYLAHLGSSKVFTAQLYDQVASYVSGGAQLVFISDGASWIRNWIEDRFDNPVSILDYYHASEYLHEFARSHFKEQEQKTTWTSKQEDLLLAGKVNEVMANMEQMDGTSDVGKKVIDYYKSNQDRMDYKKYRKMGIGMIGSGAIESAHRTVIQKRMKLSGQRWSKKGAQHMLNLRVVKMNNQWGKVIDLVKTDLKNVA